MVLWTEKRQVVGIRRDQHGFVEQSSSQAGNESLDRRFAIEVPFVASVQLEIDHFAAIGIVAIGVPNPLLDKIVFWQRRQRHGLHDQSELVTEDSFSIRW